DVYSKIKMMNKNHSAFRKVS
ncbi:hypothetical protein, partial [Escherichia coli]